MKLFVHEKSKGEAEIYESAAAWALDPETASVPDWFKKLLVKVFEHGMDKYTSIFYGQFYIIDLPPFYTSGELMQGH